MRKFLDRLLTFFSSYLRLDYKRRESTSQLFIARLTTDTGRVSAFSTFLMNPSVIFLGGDKIQSPDVIYRNKRSLPVMQILLDLHRMQVTCKQLIYCMSYLALNVLDMFKILPFDLYSLLGYLSIKWL